MASTKKKSSNRKKTNKKDPYSDEIIVIISLVISLILILSNFHLCGRAGDIINAFTFGIMGFLAYVFPVILFLGTAFEISNRGSKDAKRKFISSIILLFVFAALLQLITSGSEVANINILEFYKKSASLKNGGGLFGGIICKVLYSAFGIAGTYIILFAMIAVLVMFISEKFLFASIGKKSGKKVKEIREKRREYIENRDYENSEEEYAAKRRKAKTFTFEKDDSKYDEKKSCKKIEEKEVLNVKKKNRRQGKQKDIEMEEIVPERILDFPIQRSESVQETNSEGILVYQEELKNKFDVITEEHEKKEDKIYKSEQEDNNKLNSNIDISETNKNLRSVKAVESEDKIPDKTEKKENSIDTSNEIEIGKIDENVGKDYKFPSLNLLSKPKGNKKVVSDKQLKETAMKLQTTLESFGVRVTITNVSCGPSVTRYELQPEQGVKVSRITNLADDIKLNLAAADVRIEAPIPGKAAVGIEIPNKENSMVMFRELVESSEFKNHKSDLAFAVGKDIGGKTVVTDIAKMPHLLIAGATGSGKSVCINTLIMSILYKASPDNVKLIMVDPKVVELNVYNGIPHLLIPVVTDPKKASAALNWAVMEMTDRYNKFAEIGVRDIRGYNEKIKTVEEYHDEKYKKMPQIVIIVDELADLMMVAPGEVEDSICRLAQLARAAGIHLIIATQRPSVNVITGLIKANIPSRIAFSVSSAIDSRTILDGGGAEKLLGKGDMLFFPSGYPKPIRVQGAFVSDKEVSGVVEFLNEQQSEPLYNEEVKSQIENVQSVSSAGGQNQAGNVDDYFVEAGKFIIEKDKASIGMLQRSYKIGFNRAARIMDQLFEAGVVGPEEGTKPRKVLMSLEEFEQYIEEYV